MLDGATILYLGPWAAEAGLAGPLEAHGARFLRARSVAEAWAALHGSRPTLILCETGGGEETLRQVRRLPIWRSIPLVAVTGAGEAAYRRAMNAGADGSLPRPFSARQVLLELSHVLRRQAELVAVSGVSLRLLGAQQVRRGDVLLRAPDRGAEKLVFYLLLAPLFQTPPSREEVVSRLWGTISPGGFRGVLSRAKRWSAGWGVWCEPLEFHLTAEARCDVHVLHEALREGVGGERLERLYAGPLLPATYDDWALAWREQLGGRVKEAFLRDAVEATGRERARSLRRALAADPFDLELQARYARSLKRAGLHLEARQAETQSNF